MRRIAVRELVVGDHIYKVRALEMEGDRVVRHYPLTRELPHTEWLPCRVRLTEDGRIETTKN